MPSKFRKAIGAVKDQTSISIAKVSSKTNATHLEVAILKATTHEHMPIEERYVLEILQLVSSNKAYAAACAQAISKRIGKTRNWIVALKSLIIVLRVFQDGDPYFPREVLHAMKRGAKILNLATFREDPNSSPWEYTAFVRTFALYLDERLDCILAGKMQRQNVNRDGSKNGRRTSEPVHEMKPSNLLEKLSYWQRLVDRAIAIRPTGAAKSNKLVQISLYAVVQESFDLYRDFSDGLAHILDSFFHLPYQSCVFAFQICVRATKQYQELSQFYDMCKSLGVGRTSEYPSVQKISDELIETLQEFLKDQASFPTIGTPPSPHIRTPTSHHSRDIGTSSDQFDKQSYCLETTDTFSDRTSELGSISRSAALEDLMCNTEAGTSSSFSIDRFSEQLHRQLQQEETTSLPDSINSSLSDNNPGGSTTDSVWLDDWPQDDSTQEQDWNSTECWALDLFESAKSEAEGEGFLLSVLDNIFDQPSTSSDSTQQQFNSFLDDSTNLFAPASDKKDVIDTPRDKQAIALTFPEEDLVQGIKPTFSVQSPNANQIEDQDDPFRFCPRADAASTNCESNGLQQNVLQEQQLWLENQNRIISKHLS